MAEITLASVDAKVDTLGDRLDAKVDALGARLDAVDTKVGALDSKVDAIATQLKSFVTHDQLKVAFAKAFEQTQGGFNDHRADTEFVVERSAKALRKEMNQRFDGMDDRFDRLETRFDQLEELIKGRPVTAKRPRRRS